MSPRVAPIRSRRRAIVGGPRPPYLRAILALALLIATLVLTADRPEPARETAQREARPPVGASVGSRAPTTALRTVTTSAPRDTLAARAGVIGAGSPPGAPRTTP